MRWFQESSFNVDKWFTQGSLLVLLAVLDGKPSSGQILQTSFASSLCRGLTNHTCVVVKAISFEKSNGHRTNLYAILRMNASLDKHEPWPCSTLSLKLLRILGSLEIIKRNQPQEMFMTSSNDGWLNILALTLGLLRYSNLQKIEILEVVWKSINAWHLCSNIGRWSTHRLLQSDWIDFIV